MITPTTSTQDQRLAGHWRLDDLFAGPNDPAIDASIADLLEKTAQLEAARETLGPEMPLADFLSHLETLERIRTLSMSLAAYAYLLFAEDTQNTTALNLRSRLEQLLTELGNRTLFLTLWFKDLPDEAAQRFIDAAGDRRYYLESLRRFRPHTLSEAEEKIINLKDVNGVNALVKVYELVTNRFSFTLQVDGVQKTLTRDQLSSHYSHPSPDVRAAAYRELFRVYSDHSTLLAQIYSNRVRDWHAEALQLRGYATPMSVRNLGNNLPDPVIDTLLETCRQNAPLFQRYFRLKARHLGMDKLRRYDIYAPLAQAQKSYPIEQGIALVMESLREFSPRLADLASRVLDEQHLDWEPRSGKRAGAFSFGVLPGLTPWILQNYAGRAKDVGTLAHELGHAIHSMLAADHSILTFQAPLPLAETASVFAESLLTDRMLQQEPDPAVRRDLLVHALDDTYGTVLRQAYFSLFEREAHRMIAQNQPMEALAARYLEILSEQFGDVVEVAEEFQWEWISIPHIYNVPFYTYAYSFGQLLVLSLYQQYLSEGEPFKARYIKILSYGGSAAPARILEEAGLDITSAAFWQGGFDVVKGMIDRLEELDRST